MTLCRKADEGAQQERGGIEQTRKSAAEQQKKQKDCRAEAQQDHAGDRVRVRDRGRGGGGRALRRRGVGGVFRLCLRLFTAHQSVERHAEQLAQPQELFQLRHGCVRLPFGDRLARDVQRVCKIALRPALLRAQTGNAFTECHGGFLRIKLFFLPLV